MRYREASECNAAWGTAEHASCRPVDVSAAFAHPTPCCRQPEGEGARENQVMKHDTLAPYYSELGRLKFSPGWARPEPSMWPVPKPKFKPAVWRVAAARAALDQAGEVVPVEQAERRNLIMVNPIEGNLYATTRNLVSA